MRTLIKNIIDTFTARVTYTMAIACTRFLRRVYTTAVVCVLLVAVCVAQMALFGQSTPAYAAFNKEINYQGKLTNSSNVAVPDGTYHMRFKLYTVATGGVSIWDEDRSTDTGDRITVTNGLFSVMLGSSTPLTSVNFDQTLYLGVEIGGSSGSPSWDGEMTPRKKLGAVPAAFVADTVDGLSSEQFLRADATNATNTASTFLTITQNGAGDIANFIGPSSASVLTVRSGGNVGIGTSSPYAKLSVAGQVVGQYFTATGTTASTFPYASTTALSVSGTGYFAGSGIWNSSGFVGVGTTSPWAQFSINPDGIGSASAFAIGSSTKTLFTVAQNGAGVSINKSGVASVAELEVFGNSSFGTVLLARNDSNVGNGEQLGMIGFDGLDSLSTGGTSYAADIKAFATESHTNTAKGTYMTFNVKPNGTSQSAASVEVLRLSELTNVGIGTTSPFAKLQVATSTANATFKPQFVITDTGGGTDAKHWYLSSESSSFRIGSTSDAYATSTYLTIANGGNVGIGTTSPATKLSVQGNGYVSGTLFVGGAITSTSSTASTFPYASTTAITVSGTASTTALNISGISGCSGSNALTTNSSGVVACGAITGTGGAFPFTPTTNFGVNTSATSTPIWAQAGLYASSTSRFVDVQTYGVLYAGITGSLPATAIVAQGSGVAITGNAGDYFVEIADDDDNKALHTTDAVGNVGTLSDTSSGAGVYGSGVTYGVSGTNSSASGAGVNALQYDASGYAIYASGGKNYFQGNVGIGTTSPYAKLSVVGQVVGEYFTGTSTATSTFNGSLGVGTSTPGAASASSSRLTIDGGGLGLAGINIANLGASAVYGINLATAALSGATDYFMFNNTNDYWRADGVLNAASQIWVTGTARINTTQTFGIAGNGASIPGLSFSGDGNTGVFSPSADIVGLSTAGEERLRATATGNIGISTTSPWARLSVGSHGGGTQPQFVIASSTGTSATSTQFIVDQWGNVGIGTANPDAKLEIAGNLYFTANANRTIGFDGAGGVDLSILGASSATVPGGDIFIGAGNDDEAQAVGGSVYIYPGSGSFNGAVVLGHNGSSSFGNVGVGTTSPATKLSVQGNGYVSGTLFVGGAITSTSSTASTFPYASTTAITVSGTASTTALNISGISGCSGSNALTTNSSGVVACGAITGTGGAFPFTPTTNFGVNTSATSTPIWAQAGLYASSTSYFPLGTWNSSGFLGVGTTSPWGQLSINPDQIGTAPSFVIGSSTQTHFIVTNQGYVGIGTTTPEYPLHVVAATSTDGAPLNVLTVEAVRTGGTPSAGFGPAILFKDAAVTSDFMAKIASLYEDASGGSKLGSLAFYTPYNGGSESNLIERMRITHDGWVGIGSTSPSALLTINTHLGTGHTWSPNIFTVSSSTLTATSTHFVITSGGNSGFGTTSPWGQLSINPNQIGTGPAFVIGSSTRTNFIVTNSGRVGVGTSSPGGTFAAQGTDTGFDGSAVAGNILLTGGSGVLNGVGISGSTGGAVIITGGKGGDNNVDTDYNGGDVLITGGTTNGATGGFGGGTGGNVVINPGVGTTTGNILLATTNAGKVGVGTTSPWGLLSVNGNAIGTAPQFVVGSSTKTDLIVTNAGNVGIGTTNPSYKLHVVGSGSEVLMAIGDYFKMQADGLMQWGTSFGNGVLTWDTNVAVVGSQASKDLVFTTNSNTGSVSAEKMRITSTGNVGIGTTSPYAKLSVVGEVAGAYFTATTSTASIFPYASTTAITVSGTASTTALNISGISGCSGSNALTTNSSGVVACGAIVGGSGAYPFTPSTNFNTAVSATSTPIWAQAGLYASSTSQFAYATATALTVTGTAYFPGGIWDSSGNVGVGTSSPWAKLSVGSNGGTQPQFVVASSTGSGATSTHFIVDRWGNVAIGSSTVPSSSSVTGTRLYVYSGTSGQGSPSGNANDFIIEGGTNNTGLSILNNSARTGSIVFGNENDNDVAGIIYSHTQATMQLIANANLAQIITSTGNTGFSTSSPWARLSVGSANSTAPQFVIASSSTGIATSTQFIVDALGNVGIGTTSPWAQLSVNPNNAFGPLFTIGSSTATQFLVSNSGSVMIGTTTSLSTDKLSINGGNLFIRSLTPQFVLVDTQSTDNNFGMRAQNGIASFFRANNDSTLSAFLTTFDLANLRVGIGTTSPYAKLSVVGQVVGAYFTATTSTASTFPYASTTALSASVICIAGDCQSAWPSGGGAFPFTPATNFGVNTSATSTPIWAQAGLYASSTSYFPFGTWDSSGNVGIGTTSPAAALAFNASTVAAGGINFGSDVNLYRSAADSLKTDDNFYVSTGIVLESGSTGRIYANGGLVNLSSANNARIRTTDSGVVIDRNIADGATTFYVKQLNASATGDLFQLANSSATTTVFTQSGSVGIGTTSPYAKLSVAGQVVGEYFTATSSIASTFPYASTTAITVSGTASTTALNISGISGCSGSNALTTNSSGVVACGAIVGGSGAYPFTPTTHFGVDTSATSTPIWAQAGLYASSTSYFQRAQIGSGSLFNSAMFHIGSSTNSFLQANIQNYSNGGSASSDWIATNDIGTDSTYYVDLGINSSGYNDAAYTITSANDAYLYAQSNALAIGTATSSTLGVIKFHTGGTLAANERMRITSTGLVGIGSTSPYAQLSVVGGGNNGVFPSFVVATTSSWVNGAQQPLFYVTATTSGKLNYSRVAIGTTSPWGASGLRDQFTVDGRIYSTWRYLSCDVGGSAGTTFAADTSGACGDFAFDFDADATAILTNQSYPPYIELRAGHANPTVGDGSSIRTTIQVASATSSPVFEAWVQASSTTIATTTPLYIVGLVNSLFGADTGTMPTQGAYFIATTSPNWKLVTRSANNVETMTDSGLATSTNQFRKMRIELTPTEAIFLVNGAVIAQHTSNIPTATLAPTTLLANFAGGSVTASAHRSLYVSLMRFWMDDPVGPTIAGLPAGEEEGGIASEYDFSSYDPISAAAITAPYLVGDQADFKEGTVVSFHEEDKARVRVSNKAYDQNTFGVVGMTSVQNLGETNTHTVNVALSGRVPVRVSLENGNIQPGDYLTSSSIPGVAMKATASGAVLGRAIQIYDEVTKEYTDMVMMSVELGYYTGSVLVQNAQGNVGVGTTSDAFKLTVSGDVGAYGFSAFGKASMMNEISAISDEDLSSYLEKIKNTTISTYRYKDEAATAPLRLGIVADQAPSEILSVSGEDVDVYKLAVLTLGGVKALENKFNALDLRVTALENQIFGFASSTATSTATTTVIADGSFFDQVISHLENLGVRIAQGIAEFKNVIAETLIVGSPEKPSGITLYDEVTGEPYCLTIANGKMKNRPGECGAEEVEETVDTSDNTSETQSQEQQETQSEEKDGEVSETGGEAGDVEGGEEGGGAASEETSDGASGEGGTTSEDASSGDESGGDSSEAGV